MALKHFLTLLDSPPKDLQALIRRGIELKAMQKQGISHNIFHNKVLAMIFAKSSTRTRVSFEAAMIQGGGGSIFLSPNDSQLGRGEPIEDMARVLSGMVDAVMIRTFAHSDVELFARYASVPVINGLTDDFHPCQLLADMQTYYEHRGSIQGKTVAWVSDGNNMCHSYINAARQYDFTLNIAAPKGYWPRADIVQAAGDRVNITTDPRAAVENADLIVTDVWASMGQEAEQAKREQAFEGFQVDEKLMALADKDALFMHCLPAHRGEEVSAAVLESPQSVVWEEAANRLHAQKALLEYLL
jgi:ornithine carbamoyltransferase